jgi:AcrR family transcriptional regulator
MKIKESSPEFAAVALAVKSPEMGQFRAARELRKQGVQLSPSGVRLIWKRHGLSTVYERLLARQREAEGPARTLSDAQKSLLQRARVTRRLFSDKAADSAPAGKIRRDQLLTAAARVFSEKGYEGASLKEICAAAGILPGSLYYHFRSKEDLFVTVHAEGFRQLNEVVDQAIALHGDPWLRYEALCAAHIRQLVVGTGVTLFTGQSLFHTTLEAALRRRLARDRDSYEQRHREMIDALDLPRDVDRTLLRLTILGALNWTRVWYRPGKKTPEQLAHHLVATIVRSLSRPAPARDAG